METALMWHVVKSLEILAQDVWHVDTPLREQDFPLLKTYSSLNPIYINLYSEACPESSL